jgi:hypothetical protein
MKRTAWFSLLSLILVQVAFAHDEGHGPKLTDAGRQGGVVAPVVSAKDAKKGASAELVYKAELVRSDDGTVRIYFYDKDMKPLDTSKFAQQGEGVIEFKKGKKWETSKFAIRAADGAYSGTAPKPSSKPFNIDIHVKEGGRELLSAFDNLD